jgi:acyl-coenzyme A synthetase/AMP-(fatty) acid ligase
MVASISACTAAHTTFKYVFDYRDKDVYFCTADCGWITGHTYITYGPLLAGATSVMFEAWRRTGARSFFFFVILIGVYVMQHSVVCSLNSEFPISGCSGKSMVS